MRTQSASVGLSAAGRRAFAGARNAAATMNVVAVGSFFKHMIKGIVILKFAGKTRVLDFVDKEKTLILSSKQLVLDFTDKIRKLKFGRKET